MPRAAVLLGVLALAACRTEPPSPAPPAPASPAGALVAASRSVPTPSASMPCGASTLDRTACMIELILADVRASYDWPEGGGISEIVGTSSTSYTVSLPQEERTDLLVYDFTVRGDTVSISGKREGAEGY